MHRSDFIIAARLLKIRPPVIFFRAITCSLADVWAFQRRPAIVTLKPHHEGYLRPRQVEEMIETTSQLSCIA